MIQLAHDCLFFQLPNGDCVPLRSDTICVEISGDGPAPLEPEVVSHAIAAVFHYFKHDLERFSVRLEEFSAALEKVLRRLAQVWDSAPAGASDEWWADLGSLAIESEGSELAFFTRLREELRGGLASSPALMRFHGLHDCVKHLAGARRWSGRCRSLRDEIDRKSVV